jgi:ribonuclease P protein subunit POP4
MRTPKNLPRHELIGLEVKIIESENRDEKGITGKVVDERKSILKIEVKDEEKTVRKKGRTFEFALPSGKKTRIGGEVIEGRPKDRIKKRLKKW